VLWLAGGLVHGDVRVAIWLVAALSTYVVMWLGFPLPGMGRSRTTDYTITGGHLAHRCFLFIIIALGESILITGANFGELPSSAGTVAAFVVAFVGSATLWWIYFDRSEEAGLRMISAAPDPGRLGLTAYTFFHPPLVAGIIVAAAADELTIAHPADEATVATTSLILGGPVLYLVGNALFSWALWDYVPRSRLVAIGALAALAPVAVVASALGLMVAATLVLVALALWDVRTGWRPPTAGKVKGVGS
jgi:low temperature requirement protein LtrA